MTQSQRCALSLLFTCCRMADDTIAETGSPISVCIKLHTFSIAVMHKSLVEPAAMHCHEKYIDGQLGTYSSQEGGNTNVAILSGQSQI